MGRINKVSAKKAPLQIEQRPRISCVYQSPGTMKEAGERLEGERERGRIEGGEGKERVKGRKWGNKEAEGVTKGED